MLCVLLVAPAWAMAAEVRNDPAAVVGPGESIEDDVFVSSARVATISGHVTGDAYAVANTVIVNGKIDGDLIAAAQEVVVDGTVRGNLRAAGSSVTINGDVGHNLTGLAQHVNLSSNAHVDGGILVAAQSIDALGYVGRGITVGGGTLQLAGPVGGPVQARVERLSIAPSAHLASTLNYQAGQPADVPAGTVTGAVHFEPTPQATPRPMPAPAAPLLNGLFDLGGLVGLVGSFLIGALALILMPRASARAVELGRQRPWQSFGLGALVLFATPIAGLLIAITLIGLPAAFFITLLYMLGLFLAAPAVGLAAGMELMRRVRPDRPLAVLGTLAVGLIVVHLVTHLPFIGPLLGLCAIAYGLGMLAQALRHPRQDSEPTGSPQPFATAA
jgi:hypothetical protein